MGKLREIMGKLRFHYDYEITILKRYLFLHSDYEIMILDYGGYA